MPLAEWEGISPLPPPCAEPAEARSFSSAMASMPNSVMPPPPPSGAEWPFNPGDVGAESRPDVPAASALPLAAAEVAMEERAVAEADAAPLPRGLRLAPPA